MKVDNGIKVSVLVPICNVEKYLEKCLSSIVNQSLKEIEIICINDGSTDKSLEIIKKFAYEDSRIIIIDKPNSGYGDSMNKGLEVAKGEYVGIVESDDFISEVMFQELYKVAAEENVDIVKSNFYLYWEEPEKIVYHNNLRISKVERNLEVCRGVLFSSSPSIWSAIYKREWLISRNIKFLPTPGASFQDVSFKFKTTALARSIVLLPDAYLYYRQDNPNSSVKSTAIEKVYLNHKEYDAIYDFLILHNLMQFSKFYCNNLYNACVANYCKISPKDRDEYYSFLLKCIEPLEKFSVDKKNFSKLLKYGGYYALKHKKRWMLDILVALKNIKRLLK